VEEDSGGEREREGGWKGGRGGEGATGMRGAHIKVERRRNMEYSNNII
jgi:hypothetical protein